MRSAGCSVRVGSRGGDGGSGRFFRRRDLGLRFVGHLLCRMGSGLGLVECLASRSGFRFEGGNRGLQRRYFRLQGGSSIIRRRGFVSSFRRLRGRRPDS